MPDPQVGGGHRFKALAETAEQPKAPGFCRPCGHTQWRILRVCWRKLLVTGVRKRVRFKFDRLRIGG